MSLSDGPDEDLKMQVYRSDATSAVTMRISLGRS
jgi:hypothetical protein